MLQQFNNPDNIKVIQIKLDEHILDQGARPARECGCLRAVSFES
jgi:hypothetical protein